MVFLRYLLVTSYLLCLGWACSCLSPPLDEKFCLQDWVSHLLVKQKSSNPNPFVDVFYTVQHIKVFRNTTGKPLPSMFSTPSQGPACGLELDLNKEYLVAGSYRNGRLTATLCEQITPEGFPGIVAEWKMLPSGFCEKLSSIKCPKKEK